MTVFYKRLIGQMCGIAGEVVYKKTNTVNQASLEAVSKAMHSRGPDGHSIWLEGDQSVAFVHRRLAIIDLTEDGAQPMLDVHKRYVITFNGEIYNYRELRQKCLQQGYQFQSNSDTEVLLALYESQGEEMVSQLRGMFAFAIYDRENKTVFLARDHLGIKPLYYMHDKSGFKFASSIRAMREGKWLDETQTSSVAKAAYLNLGSIPEPLTCYQTVHMLPAAYSALLNSEGELELSSYWNLDKIDQAESTTQDDQQVIEQAVRKSVACHLESDVPVGVFLSAGIDSSVVAAMMKRCTNQKIVAITLGFDEFDGKDDEVEIAKQFAEKQGFEHYVYKLSREEFLDELPKFYAAMEQPTIDALNVWFVSKAAQKLGIKVVLSGIGGDELFGGYPSFQRIPKLLRWASIVRYLPIKFIAKCLPNINTEKLGYLAKYSKSSHHLYHLQRSIFLKEELSTELSEKGSIGDSCSDAEMAKILHELDVFYAKHIYKTQANNLSIKHSVSKLETQLYMRNQLLRDADWAGMAHSIEIRTPLVDKTLVEAIYTVDDSIRFAPNKSALLNLLDAEDKQRIENRAKTGFILPMEQWLKGSSSEAHWSRHYAKMVGKQFFQKQSSVI